jgi:leader peptidase (prepilin peptidase)/N-methyltransferase
VTCGFRPLTSVLLGGAITAGVLVGLTFLRFGLGAVGCAWAVVQLLLVFVALVDVSTRRIPNHVTLPAAVVTLALRGSFVPSSLSHAVVAAAVTFVLCLVFAVVSGGFGMGDVKLAALLGLLLGTKVLPALVLGVVAGGIASTAVLVARRGRRGGTIAYAPYLCLGGALTVLLFHPPPLI